MFNKKITVVLFTILFTIATFSAKAGTETGYCIMRVFDCTKSIGSSFVNPSIIITYENGEQETIELASFSKNSEHENLKKIGENLNILKKKGYTLITSTLTGDQGSMIYEYIFLKLGE